MNSEIYPLIVYAFLIAFGIGLKLTKNASYEKYKKYWMYFIIAGAALFVIELVRYLR